MRQIKLIFFAAMTICLTFTMAGCKSKKVVTNGSTKQEAAAKKSVDQLIAAKPVFENARADNSKVSVKYSGHNLSANAEININYGQAIKVAVKVFGIEMAIAEITPAHVVLVDKMNKRYTESTFAELQAMTGMPITFNDVQALLTNSLFAIGTPTDKIKSLGLQSAIENGSQVISFTSSKISHRFTVNTQTSRITKTYLQTASGNSTVSVDYDNFKQFDNILFPTTITLLLSNKQTSATATVNLATLKFNQGAFTSPVDTRKLTKVDIKAIIPGL